MKLVTFIFFGALFNLSSAYADQWDYDIGMDKMTGKANSTARIMSSNVLDLEFPYAGANYGFLTVRKHPQHGLDVIVSISKGQILCPSYNGCTAKIRFGDGQPMTFAASGPADHSSTAIFLRNAQKFIDQAKKTKTIKVQLTIFRAGAQVLEFDSPSPLVWGASQTKATLPKGKEKPIFVP